MKQWTFETVDAQIAQELSGFLPVGFYYKAFHRPKWLAPRWETFFRFMSGLGKVKFDAPRVVTPKRYDFCDVLVIGTGPAGLSAAIAAASAGARVLAVDENIHPGGSLGFARSGGDEALSRLNQLLERAQALPNIEIRSGTCAAGYYTDHWVSLVMRCA